MTKYLQKLKPFFFAMFWFLLGVWFVVFISASDEAQNKTICHSATVKVDHEYGNYFVDDEDIVELIKAKLPGEDFGIPVGKIDLEELEWFLEANPYISNAEIYIDINGKMWVDVAQKYPLARVINDQNQSYYISTLGEKMPITSAFSARVPIISGHVEDNGTAEGDITTPMMMELFQFVEFLEKDIFWKSMIEQVYVEKDGQITLIPKVGDHKILMGRLNRVPAKLDRLLLFYKEGLANVGWEQYKTINITYNNQIVCTKK